jgi:hypothetical protein
VIPNLFGTQDEMLLARSVPFYPLLSTIGRQEEKNGCLLAHPFL